MRLGYMRVCKGCAKKEEVVYLKLREQTRHERFVQQVNNCADWPDMTINDNSN